MHLVHILRQSYNAIHEGYGTHRVEKLLNFAHCRRPWIVTGGLAAATGIALTLWSITERAEIAAWVSAPAFIMALLITNYAYFRILKQDTKLRAENEVLKNHQLANDREMERETHARSLFEDTLKRERELLIGGPVVLFRCAAVDGWPIEYISPNVVQFGYDFKTLAEERTPYKSLIHPQDLPRVEAIRLRGQGIYGMPYLEIDYRIVTPDQRVKRVYAYMTAIYDGGGEVTHYDGYALDITHVDITEHALSREKERARIILRSIPDAVITIDSRGHVESVNRAGEQLIGVTLAEAKGKPLARVFKVREVGTDKPLHDTPSIDAQAVEPAARSAILHRRDGSTLPVRQSSAVLRDGQGAAIGTALVLHDMSEPRSGARRLDSELNRDKLTSLIDQHQFQNAVGRALRVAFDDNHAHVCLYLTLDQHKIVNDACGRTAGDQMLRELTAIFRQRLRQSDTIARLDGYEFGALLWYCLLPRGLEIAQILRTVARAFRFKWEDKRFEIGVSIGIVPITRESRDVTTILNHSHIACHVAKDLGRNRIHVFEAGDASYRGIEAKCMGIR